MTQKLVYKEVFQKLNGNINIPFSIQIEKEAHIYLCDGDTPPDSNCYWIMLGMNNGKMSQIRKCGSGQISFEPKTYPTDPSCKRGLVKVKVSFVTLLINFINSFAIYVLITIHM